MAKGFNQLRAKEKMDLPLRQIHLILRARK
jgi:hypothetical protein